MAFTTCTKTNGRNDSKSDTGLAVGDRGIYSSGSSTLNMQRDALMADVDSLVNQYDLHKYRGAFYKGAMLADMDGALLKDFRDPLLSSDDMEILIKEIECPASALPATQFFQAGLCALCAVVQGMDQTIINGAQEFYFAFFGITDPLMKGFINSAPYCSAALIGCWLNQPLNRYFGRRGTIFISCVVAFGTALMQAFSPTWEVFVLGRLLLGLAVGAKSATTPVYAAECAPPAVRGRLTMMWQMFTGFGIMLGYIASLAFQSLDVLGPNTQWQWMLGITGIPPLVVCVLVYTLPESPRYLLDRGKFNKALESMLKLRKHDFQATRDIYAAHRHIQEVKSLQGPGRWNTVREFMKPRNLRAAQSAWFCMFMQQFCGVNVIAYYSTRIFMEAGFTRSESLAVSLGCGVANFLGAIPALYTIDRFGRRSLLLFTFPFLSLCLFWTGGSFYINEGTARVASVCTSLYAFMLFYSPGMGPVPFTYSAEAFSLSVRPLGMASATSVTWAFNFLINFSWPKMMEAMTPFGGFCFYAAWNVFGWIFTYFLLPETKGRSLEQLDETFSRPNKEHVMEKWKDMRQVMRRNRAPVRVDVDEIVQMSQVAFSS